MTFLNDNLSTINKGLVCPYCNCGTELVTDKDIYGPQSNYGGMFYRCLNNKDHYVGTHSDNKTSLGRLADKELRPWKSLGHSLQRIALDQNIFCRTQQVYNWLSHRMELDRNLTHFGMFDIPKCKKAISLLIDKITDPDISPEEGRYIDEFGVIYSADRTKLIDAHTACFMTGSYDLLPETRIICSGAFHHLRNIKNISFNQGLQIVGREAFNRCSNWDEQVIAFPDTLEYISSSAFSSCWGINAIFPMNLKYIGAWAFWDTLVMCFQEQHNELICRFGKEIFTMPECVQFDVST